MKTYTKASKEVKDRATDLIRKYHPEVEEADVTIEFMMVRTNVEGESALKLHGKPCAGICKIVSLPDRAKGCKDVEISLDAEVYDSLDDPARDALIDHELEHIVVNRDRDGDIDRDSADRPKLTIKKHDIDVGWFTNIAQRHGRHSMECYQAKRIMDREGQYYFPGLSNTTLEAEEVKV